MKRSSALLIIALLILVCGRSQRDSPEAKRSNIERLWEVQPKPKEPEPTAASPEDPGPTETVISPLAILKQQAIPSPINPEERVRYEPLPIDHHVDVPSEKPRSILHKVFSIRKYAQFAFVAPPHQGNTRLRGSFRSFSKRSDPDTTSDRTADVDLMLLNEQEFNEFLHGQPESVTYELDSAHNQKVDWRVPTTYGEPQTYHLVFSNSGSATKIKFVEADFTVSFE
jgi:hypothetical protein